MTAVAAPAAYFTLALDQAKEELARRGVPIFDFGVGDPNEPTPEFIRQALIDAVDPVSQYPTVVGQRQLRQAIAGWAQRRLDVTLDPDAQVLPASGSKEAIFHLPLAVGFGRSDAGFAEVDRLLGRAEAGQLLFQRFLARFQLGEGILEVLAADDCALAKTVS